MGRPAQFNLEDLAQAGLRVVRRQGWASMSIQAVAGEISVTPMALYRLVPDADGLKRLVADAAGEPLAVESSESDLVDALSAWAVRAHDHLGRLPGLTTYVIREWTELPRWLAIVEAFLARADDHGLTGPVAVHTVNAVFSYALARVQVKEGAARKRLLRPLRDDPSRFPHIRSDVSEYRIARTETAFNFGLDALTAGLRQMAARSLVGLR